MNYNIKTKAELLSILEDKRNIKSRLEDLLEEAERDFCGDAHDALESLAEILDLPEKVYEITISVEFPLGYSDKSIGTIGIDLKDTVYVQADEIVNVKRIH